MKHHSEIMSRFAKVDTDKPTTPRENRNDGSDEKTQRMASSNRGWRTSSTHFRWGLSWALVRDSWLLLGSLKDKRCVLLLPRLLRRLTQTFPKAFLLDSLKRPPSLRPVQHGSHSRMEHTHGGGLRCH